MQVTDFTRQAAEGKLVLTGMVASDRVCGAVSEKWEADGLFDSAYLDRIGQWCVDHYRRFNKAPGKQVLIYHRRYAAKKSRPDEESQAIDSLLADMSQEYIRREAKTLQADYVIQVATELFTATKVRRLTDQARDLISAGKQDKAVEVLNSVAKVDMTSRGMISVFEAKDALTNALTVASEPLIVYPGAAGHFFKNRLRRRAFVAFEGPEKRGKSFWLMDVAVTAVKQGLKVAYFECGDMPQEDVLCRLVARTAGRAVDPEECGEGGVYYYPVSLVPGGGEHEEVTVVLQERRVTSKLTPAEGWPSFQKVTKRYGPDKFKLSCHPTKTISVGGVAAELDREQSHKRWVPDVVVVDYADILAPVIGTADSRDQINHTWAMLRSMAMARNCLVVTATQTNRGSYSADTIDMEHSSDDKRKLSHTTFMVGINQTETEKEQGLYRLNPVVARTGQYSKKKCLVTASCLAQGNPMVLCCY